MKYILITVLMLAGLTSGFAQKSEKRDFTITGKIKGKPKGFIYLSYAESEGKYKQDSAAIKNGAFVFKGSLREPAMAMLASSSRIRNMDDPNLSSIFIEPVAMKLQVEEGAFRNLKLSGSGSQDENEALTRQKEPIRKEMQPFVDAYMKEKDHEKAAAIREQFEPFNARMDKIDSAFMAAHPDSYVTAYIMKFKMSSLTLKEASTIFNGWTDKLKQSDGGKDIAREIKKLQSGSPGSMAPVFSVKDINGSQLSLADFKGQKYVLLDFWASWCVPCRKGNPHLLSLYGKYKEKGLEIVGVSDDDSALDAWRTAVAKDQIGVWRHVLRGLKRTATGFDKSTDISGPYGIHSLPTKILIDKEGMIIGRYGGGGEGDDAMDKKLAELFEN
jgi:thiol-disulfide isomerase/thioredoxin